jgi:hypothetical protein
LDAVSRLALEGSTVAIQAAALNAPGSRFQSKGLPAIWRGLDGVFGGKLSAAIYALVQGEALRMITDGLTVDDGGCVRVLLDGFAGRGHRGLDRRTAI